MGIEVHNRLLKRLLLYLMLGCCTNLLLSICEIHIELLLQLESHLKKKLIFDARNGRMYSTVLQHHINPAVIVLFKTDSLSRNYLFSRGVV